MLRFDVFGRRMAVRRVDDGWRVLHLGDDGIHREAPGVVIPGSVTEAELGRFLADVFHESATPDRPDVVPLGLRTRSR